MLNLNKMRAVVLFILITSQVTWGAKPNYSYHVKIDDPQQANFQEKAETRLLENAKGFYSVLEPNGALRTVTYTADERGFIPVVSYSYGHPVKQVAARPAPVKILAAQPIVHQQIVHQPVRQLVQQQAVYAPQTQYIQSAPAQIAVPAVAPLSLPQRVVAAPTIAQTFVSAPAPLRKTLVATNGGPVGFGGYSYGVSSADNYALSYGTPGFTYSATRKFSHPVQVFTAARPVIQKQVFTAPQPVIQKQVFTAPLPVIQKQVFQSAPAPIPISPVPVATAVETPVAAPVIEYGPPNHRPPPVIENYAPQYISPPQPQFIAQKQHRIVAPVQFPVIQRQIHTVQPAQVALPYPQPLRIERPANIIPPAIPLQIPQIAYGAPTFNYRAPEIRAPIQTINYAPQHVQYTPAPVLKQVQLAQPQIQLSQLSQAQINYVPPQLPAPVVQNVPLTTEVRIPAPAPVPVPIVHKQVVAGNGLRITGNALAVPAANGLKNPLTFAYSYGSGASQVSHSYSGSGW